MWKESPLLRDAGAAVLTVGAAMAVLRFWEQVGNSALLDQKLCRKLVHISVGLVYFLMWPLFSADDVYAPFLASLAIALNIVRVTLIGLGIVKDDGVVNSVTRHGDHRELLRGPLYYACAITLTTVIFWRTSPISIAVICNLCAGDGAADIAGRRFGKMKLPYNPCKSYAGTIAMFFAGFITSIMELELRQLNECKHVAVTCVTSIFSGLSRRAGRWPLPSASRLSSPRLSSHSRSARDSMTT